MIMITSTNITAFLSLYEDEYHIVIVSWYGSYYCLNCYIMNYHQLSSTNRLWPVLETWFLLTLPCRCATKHGLPIVHSLRLVAVFFLFPIDLGESRRIFVWIVIWHVFECSKKHHCIRKHRDNVKYIPIVIDQIISTIVTWTPHRPCLGWLTPHLNRYHPHPSCWNPHLSRYRAVIMHPFQVLKSSSP